MKIIIGFVAFLVLAALFLAGFRVTGPDPVTPPAPTVTYTGPRCPPPADVATDASWRTPQPQRGWPCPGDAPVPTA